MGELQSYASRFKFHTGARFADTVTKTGWLECSMGNARLGLYVLLEKSTCTHKAWLFAKPRVGTVWAKRLEEYSGEP